MKSKKENINDLYTTVETKNTIPDDGFVQKKNIRPMDMDTQKKHHKGYSENLVYTTSDPRITRPFLYFICGILFVIGIILFLLGRWFLGIIFTTYSIIGFIIGKRDIDAIAKKLKEQGQEVSIDSIEEGKNLQKEIKNTLKHDLNNLSKSFFTKDKFIWFYKTTVPIYCIIVIITSLLIGIFANIFLGLFIFVLLTFGGFIYYYILSKIFKH